MIKRIFFVLITLFYSSVCFSQDTILNYYEKLITGDKIYKHLEVLAADSLEGRETGETGMIKASDYVSSELLISGIKQANGNTYYQDISFVINSGSTIGIDFKNETFISGQDFYSTEMPSSDKLIQSEVIFAGYGIVDSTSGWNDYEYLNVKNKAVIILDGEPVDKNGKALIKNSDEKNEAKGTLERKLQIAKEQGASAILFVNRKLNYNSAGMSRWTKNGKYNLFFNYNKYDQPLIHITSNMADRLLRDDKLNITDYEQNVHKRKVRSKFNKYIGKQLSIRFQPTMKNCRNVAGVIEGNDKKEEYIILSAHLDHLGKRGDEIFNGADDDGSGCASILTIADVFAQAANQGYRPKRSILFIFFTGEEKGLLGSEYYVNYPLVSLESTIANLNVDMIGRVDTTSRESKYYTYIIGSNRISKELHDINEAANINCCNLSLDYTYNDPAHKLKLYERSDHYNFVKKDIPVIFYFTGIHEDYHKPTDTIDKVDTEKTAVIARLIFNTAWELANKDERLIINETR